MYAPPARILEKDFPNRGYCPENLPKDRVEQYFPDFSATFELRRGIDRLGRFCDKTNRVVWAKSCKFGMIQCELWKPLYQMLRKLATSPFSTLISGTNPCQSRLHLDFVHSNF
jgi:hypothetical protein